MRLVQPCPIYFSPNPYKSAKLAWPVFVILQLYWTDSGLACTLLLSDCKCCSPIILFIQCCWIDIWVHTPHLKSKSHVHSCTLGMNMQLWAGICGLWSVATLQKTLWMRQGNVTALRWIFLDNAVLLAAVFVSLFCLCIINVHCVFLKIPQTI